jgi:hypothetical protein
MKRINIKTFVGTALMTLFMVSCSDVLVEQPRSIYEPGFFKTEKGVMGGLTSMYAHLRYIYGQAYYYNTCLTGTDEVTYAQSADANFKDMDLSALGRLHQQQAALMCFGALLFQILIPPAGSSRMQLQLGLFRLHWSPKPDSSGHSIIFCWFKPLAAFRLIWVQGIKIQFCSFEDIEAEHCSRSVHKSHFSRFETGCSRFA